MNSPLRCWQQKLRRLTPAATLSLYWFTLSLSILFCARPKKTLHLFATLFIPFFSSKLDISPFIKRRLPFLHQSYASLIFRNNTRSICFRAFLRTNAVKSSVFSDFSVKPRENQKKCLTTEENSSKIYTCEQPMKLDSLAQSVEHLTFNQGVRGSNPRWITIYGALEKRLNSPAFHAGIQGFESPTRHHREQALPALFLSSSAEWSTAPSKQRTFRPTFTPPDAEAAY